MKAINKVKLKNAILIYLLAYFIIAGMYCGINGAMQYGEWDDYMFPTVTILENHRFGIYEEDIPKIQEYFPEWSDTIKAFNIKQLSGRTTKDGAMLTWYFPTYAIMCIPAIVLLRLLQLPAIYAFPFTNLTSVMCVLLAVFKYLKVGEKTKLILLVLLSINPVMFYFCWPSGEVLIYSFLVIGLLCWYNEWYRRAAIFISLAGTLNTTIMSIGIVMIAEYGIRLIKGKGKDTIWIDYVRKKIPEVLKYGSCYVIGLVPMAYFYYHTGYINLTTSYAGFLQGREQTWQRFLAYLFDLNFGILPYFPVVLLLGIVLLIVAIIKKNGRYIIWFLAFVVNVMLYSVMVHINSGMAGMARYNTWGVLILLFAVCLFFKELISKKTLQNAISIGIWGNAVILLFIAFHYGPTGANNTSYVKWTPIAELVLDRYPQIYNPLHSTFNSRTNHVDGGYEYETPIIYADDDGYIRKILATSQDIGALNESLAVDHESDWIFSQINSLGNNETYISVPERYKVVLCASYTIGETLSFVGENFNAQQYIVGGLSSVEDWGTWTDGNEFKMRFKTDSTAELMEGIINCWVFNGTQPYVIYVNEQRIAEGIAEGHEIIFSFPNPGAGKLIDITIELPNAISLQELGQSSDSRVLGLGLTTMVFTEGS